MAKKDERLIHIDVGIKKDGFPDADDIIRLGSVLFDPTKSRRIGGKGFNVCVDGSKIMTVTMIDEVN